MNNPSDPILLTPVEVAEILRIDRANVDDLIDRGQIAALKVGSEWRIPTDALADFLSHGLEEQRLRFLRRVLEDPKEAARYLLEQAEFAGKIASKKFPEGSMGELLQKGLLALGAEAISPNVIPFRRRDED